MSCRWMVIKRSKLLLSILGGRGAAARIALPEEYEDILDEEALWEQKEEEGSDLFRSLRIAEIMAQPKRPANLLLSLAEKWTHEMLELTEVWRCVETLANLLLEQGTIENPEKINATGQKIMFMGLNLPKWRNRLAMTVN